MPIKLELGIHGGHLKTQLKKQGYKFNSMLVNDYEAFRIYINTLVLHNLITIQGGRKARQKLFNRIRNHVKQMSRKK